MQHIQTNYSLWGIFKRFSLPIFGTFTLVVIENLVFISQPYLIGKTVDGLIASQFDDLYLYIIIMVAFITIATFRRIYDTRTYASIRAKLSIETVYHQQKADASLSEISERTALCDEILGFFEAGLFVIVKSFVEIVGSIAMLYYIDERLCLSALIAMILINFIWLCTRSRVRALFTLRNNQREQKVAEIQSKSKERIASHFNKIAALKIKLSNYEALSFGVFEILGISVFIYAAVISTGIEAITAGLLYTCLNYVTSLNNAIIRLPNVFHSIVGVNEISARLALLSPSKKDTEAFKETNDIVDKNEVKV